MLSGIFSELSNPSSTCTVKENSATGRLSHTLLMRERGMCSSLRYTPPLTGRNSLRSKGELEVLVGAVEEEEEEENDDDDDEEEWI
jgi:hypothetical protein